MGSTLPRWMRRLHRWGTVLVALPLLVVIVTGLVLLWKKDVAWVQPPTQAGSSSVPRLAFDEILEVVQGVPEADVRGWADVDRMDVRPSEGVVKVRAENRWEVQLDAATGEVLQVAYRRSDLIESLHDGSWFHDKARLWVFFPAALVLLVLWGTGLYLFVLPHSARRKKRRRAKPRREPPVAFEWAESAPPSTS